MSLTVIDPCDGNCYEIRYEGREWRIYDTATGRPPRELAGRSSWQSEQQAVKALAEMCLHRDHDARPPTTRVGRSF
jgi:hypothetical protein